MQSEGEFAKGAPQGFICGSADWIAGGAKIIVEGAAKNRGRHETGEARFLNHYAFMDCHHRICIGDRLMIGPRAYISAFDHHVRYDGVGRRGSGTVGRGAHNGNDVWIGANAVILKGMYIGDGAVAAPGLVVTKDVPVRAVVAGVPARVVKCYHRAAAPTSCIPG